MLRTVTISTERELAVTLSDFRSKTEKTNLVGQEPSMRLAGSTVEECENSLVNAKRNR